MLERFRFLVVYIGSAALAAFLAVCLSSPRVATFRCQTDDASGAQQCELVTTLQVSLTQATMPNAENPISSDPEPEWVAMTAAY